MPTATLTTKGQITIPSSLRTALGLHPGSRLDFIQEDNGFRAVPVAGDASRTLKGRFSGRATTPVTLEAMDEAIASEAAATMGPARKRLP
jgi:AbrB family looped-hinge helix DNA binding protein